MAPSMKKALIFLPFLTVAYVNGCETDADCTDDEVCVIQADGYYSQCINCDPTDFGEQCQYWSEQILEAAEVACGISNCSSKALACTTDDDCDGSDKCVIEADGNYAQCIDCDPDSFGQQCAYWSEAILEAAEETCDIDTCASKALACTTDDDCDGSDKCVIEADGNFAQCIDCDPDSFGQQCQYWSEEILEAAEETCGIDTCASKAPKCTSDDECTATNTSICVTEQDGLYAQCIDCDPTSFGQQCAYWSQAILEAAEEACGIDTCASQTPQCTTDEDCSSGNTTTCVTQSDGLYAQCIDCSEESFDTECIYWSDALLLAAQDSCDLICPTRCPNHTDEECPSGEVCAVEASGYYEQCVDCDEDSFQNECISWSDDMKAAAEAKCGLQCDSDTQKERK